MIKHLFNPELQQKIIKGISKLNDLVSLSLGPKGQTVLISPRDRNPLATKDGYTISKLVRFDDEYEDLGARIAKEVSQKNADLSGDGSTTVLVLLDAILQQAQKYLVAGAFAIDIKNGLEKFNKYLLEQIALQSKQISSKEDLFHIATISANNDEVIGKIVSDAIDMIGKDGSLLIEDSKSFETVVRVVEGFSIDSGYMSSEFITDERKQSLTYENPFILITDHKIDSIPDIFPVLEIVARDGRPLVVIAEDLGPNVLAVLVQNALKGSLRVAAIKPPRFGQERRNIMNDLALATGATFITRESGIRLKDVKLTQLGTAQSIESLKNMTTIVGGNGKQEKIQERIDYLKEEIRQTENLEEAKRIQERVTRLASGVAIIYVGGSSEIEAIEKRHRIEDSVEASRSAIEKGIVEGGGVPLMRLSLSEETEKYIKERALNEDEKFGMIILKKAIQEPFKKIIQNAGLNDELIASKCDFLNGIGYDAKNNKVVNMFESGIIDPTKVLCFALQHAVSVAISIIMSKAAIIEN